MKGRLPTREIAGLLAGFALWALAFVTLYALHGTACSLAAGSGAAPPGTRTWLAVTFAAFLVAHGLLAAWLWRRSVQGSGTPAAQLRRWSFVLAVGALIATAWTGLPVLTLSVCT